MERKGWPYGNCTDHNKYNGELNVYEDHYPVEYTNKVSPSVCLSAFDVQYYKDLNFKLR